MIKEKDFVEIEYIGIIKDTNQVFDTTDEKTAKQSKIYNSKAEYKPIILCIGENQLLPGLDKELINKELKEYTIELSPEKAFGAKNPKLLQLVSSSSFRKQNINPYPGLQITIDGIIGIIRTVTPGRIIVDFNHPLAGKTIICKIKILKEIKDIKEQLDSLITFFTHDFKTEIKDSEAVIISKNLPKQVQEHLEKKIPTLIPTIKKITIKKE